MHNNSFFKSFLLLVSILLFVSCDKDYNEIGNALIGENHFDLTNDLLSTVEASTKKTGPIASNNLDVNSLGVIENSAFGQTIANFATQVQLAAISPVIDFNLGQKVESVTLYIPYFTKNKTTNADGSSIYTLDSIYGNKTSKIKLSVYVNKSFLGKENTEGFPVPTLDPNYPQFYYTNQNSLFNEKKGLLLNDSSDPAQNNAFVFSADEFKDDTTVLGSATKTYSYTPPGMRINLNKVFFEKLLFDKTLEGYNLATNPEFERYFKGLYFDVEKADVLGVLARMNFKKGTIVVKYKEKTSSTDPTLVDKSITLTLTGNTVNLLSNESSTGAGSYSYPSPERLYLRGGEGSIATIDLFDTKVDGVSYIRSTKTIDKTKGNGIPDELDYIKEKGWLINDASLTFFIDQSLMTGVNEPGKIFLYDINNQQIFSAGTIVKDASGRGLKYKVGITDYVRGLVSKDNTNVKLGVSVAQSVSNVNFKKTDDAPLYAQWKDLKQVEKNAYFFPESSVICPGGTILYGSNASDESKRLKLEIYYTKPN
jgi:hypothetical protein